MKLQQISVFTNLILYKLVFSDTFVFQIGEHFKQSELMISGHFSSFSSFRPMLVLVAKVVSLFCGLSGLIMSLPARTTNTNPLLTSFAGK